MTQGDSCHIIPDCVEHAKNAQAFNAFWESLFGFWDYEEVSAVQEFITDPYITKRNLVVMGKETYAGWSDYIFVLSPKESTYNSLRLEFKWVRPAEAVGRLVPTNPAEVNYNRGCQRIRDELPSVLSRDNREAEMQGTG